MFISLFNLFIDQPTTHGLAYNFPVSFQEKASQNISLSFVSYLESAEAFLLSTQYSREYLEK